MRVLISIYLFILLISCRDSNIRDSSVSDTGVKIMIVPGNFDTALVCVPAYYDTSFSWLDTSGCRYSSELRFQFQPMKFKVHKENCNGVSYMGISLDTVDRITLIYSKSPFLNEGKNFDSAKIYDYHLRTFEEIATTAIGFERPFDTLQNINGHLYSIILLTLSDFNKAKFAKKLYATTNVKGNLISFTYELLCNKENSSNERFISKAMYYLVRSNPSNGM